MPHHLTARMAMLLMNLWVRFYSAVYKYDMGLCCSGRSFRQQFYMERIPLGDKYGANQE